MVSILYSVLLISNLYESGVSLKYKLNLILEPLQLIYQIFINNNISIQIFYSLKKELYKFLLSLHERKITKSYT